MAGSIALTLREYGEALRVAGDPWGDRILEAADADEELAGIAHALDCPESLTRECERLKNLEFRLMTALEDWGAIDPNNLSPPDPINVLRMLLG